MHYSDLRQSPEDREKFRASIEVSLPIFQKDFRERTREEQDELFSFLNQIPFFNEHFVSTSDKEEALLELSKAFKYEKVPRYTALYHHGDIPQKFYLLLKGDLKGFIPKTPEEIEKDVKRQAELKAEAVKSKANRSKKNGKGNKGNGEQVIDEERESFKSFGMDKKYFTEDALNFKMRKSCYPGDYLSELSIVFNSPEDDTAISWTELHLVSIDKKVYRQIFHREIEETREKLNFFFELFPQVEEDVVKTFAYAFEKRIYGSHYEVFQQGMNSDTLYAIKKGEVELWENINLNENTEKGGVNSPTIKSHHKLEKKLNGSQGMMKVSVVLLSQGQFFGEEILLGVGQRIFSAVTKSVNMLVYSISGRALLKLSHGFPDFLGYLKSQTRTSFESKLQRQGNLKKGFERINPKKNSSPPHKAKDEIEVKKKTKTLGDDQAENFSKEVMSMYLNEAMRGRDPAKKSNDSIRLQKVSEEVGGVVSPKIAQMYERMAKVRASVIHDKIKVDPTMLTEAEEAKLENKEGDRIIPQIGNLDIDLSRKFYYPEELWNSVKKGKKNNRGSKKVRQANLEKTLAKKLMDEASYELEMERKSALTINTEITSTDYDRAKVKEKSASPLKAIVKTMNSQSSDVYDDSGKEFGSASAVLLNHLRSSIRREREDSLPSGSDIPSSKFKIQDYISLSSSPKLKFAKKTGGGSTSKTSLPTISTSKSVEKLPGLFISRIEGGDSQQARFPKKKSKTMVKEPPKEILLSPKSQSIVDKLGTLESARDHKEGLIKMSKLEDRNSYRSFDATRVNSIMMDSQLTVNGKDYIAAAQGLKEMQLAIDTNVGSYQDVLESEVRGWDKTPDDPQKKIKLPKISNKKLINSKHSMFRLKPSNAKFIQDYYLPKRNMLP